MKFQSKLPDNNFTVLEYSEEEADFFTSLGFKEKQYQTGYEEYTKFLSFRGSLTFGLWTDEEWNAIVTAIHEKFGGFDIEPYND